MELTVFARRVVFPPARARERIRARFSQFACRPSDFRSGILSPAVGGGWRGGETRGDRDAPPTALWGGGGESKRRVCGGPAANDHATQRLARCVWICEAGKWRVHRRARAFIVRTDGARRPGWARSGGNLRRE